jgi:aminoglycoside phosphotransferase family enzyme/predicted kinase
VKDRPGANGAADQAEVISFLSDPASYAGADGIERVETHGNFVFLAGSDAWKIKRAVRFAYMDFSTLEKRRAACENEIAINRRFSPDLYLGCVPITRSAGGTFAFSGDGEPVEWAVHMRRFNQSALLSSIATRGRVPDDLAKSLAGVVFESHAAAARRPLSSGSTALRTLLRSVCTSLDTSDALDRDDVACLTDGLNAEVERVAKLLDSRAAGGFVRHCHGDLHLANLVVWQGRPMLYDAIEFDDTMATIDTLYDLAFLLMDLERYGQRRAPNIVLNRYLWRCGDSRDLEGLAALPLFLGLRAAIRAMVTVDRANQERGPAAQRHLEHAGAYLSAARGYLTRPAVQLIAIGGHSGTGKTTLAAALAPSIGSVPGAIHFRSDLERKSAAGVGELERLPARSYTKISSARVYSVLKEKAHIVLAAGRSVVVDAVYASDEERRDIEGVAATLGLSFHGVWLTAGREALIARVEARHNDASDATPDVVEAQSKYDIGTMSPAWSVVDAGGTTDDTLRLAASQLGLYLVSP